MYARKLTKRGIEPLTISPPLKQRSDLNIYYVCLEQSHLYIEIICEVLCVCSITEMVHIGYWFSQKVVPLSYSSILVIYRLI